MPTGFCGEVNFGDEHRDAVLRVKPKKIIGYGVLKGTKKGDLPHVDFLAEVGGREITVRAYYGGYTFLYNYAVHEEGKTPYTKLVVQHETWNPEEVLQIDRNLLISCWGGTTSCNKDLIPDFVETSLLMTTGGIPK